MSTADATAHIDDEEIAAVIDHYDDSDHPDALSVSEVRDLLAELQATLEERWDEYMASIRTGDIDVVCDTGVVIVLRDTDRTEWNDLLDEMELYDQVDRTILRMSHHLAAERLSDRDFEGVDPIVLRKPDSAEAGQQFVEAVINHLLREGVLPNEAWAYYGVDVRGYDGREWMDRCGYEDRVTVADAVETARDELEE